MNSKYRSRTFGLTIFCLLLITVGLFTDKMSDANAISGITIVLGIWSGTDAYKKKHTGGSSQ